MIDQTIDNVRINFDAENLWFLNLALALVMFGIALDISTNDFKQLYKTPKPVLAGVCSQIILLPLVTFVLVWILNPVPSIALGMFMVAACPGGNVSNFITHLSNGNSALSVSLTAITTLLAIIMTPLNLQLYGSLYEPTASILNEVVLSPLKMISLVGMLLGIPLVLGMWINHLKPILAAKMAKVLKVGSLLFFITLVFIALYQNRVIFMDYVAYVFWIVVLHNFIAFFTGYSWAKLLGLSSQNSRTLAIETGIQNSGLGLLLIFTFFDGLGGMALLTAFWGIWHLVSGLLLAPYWKQKFSKKESIV